MRKFGDALSVMLSNVLSKFGLVTRGKTFYVHYTYGQDGSNDGLTPDQPFKTLAYAVDKIASLLGTNETGEGYRIVLLEGHNEGSTGVIADLDVAGIQVIGQGVGSDRPTLDFDHANATVDVGANDILIKNVVFRPSVTAVLIGLDIESGVTGTVIEDCEFAIGEDGSGTDEFVKAIHLTSGNHDTIIRNTKILAHASAAQATHGIHVDAASDRLTFDNVIIDGPYATAGILEDAAGVNHVAVDCSVDVSGTNYGFHASSTFAKRVGNLAAGVVEDAGANLIGANNADNNASTSSVVANADGSVLERLEDLQGRVRGVGAIYYVNPSMAADTGDGLTWATAKKLMASAITAASSGDTIFFTGTIAEAKITLTKSNLRFIGAGPTPNSNIWEQAALEQVSLLAITGDHNYFENIRFRGCSLASGPSDVTSKGQGIQLSSAPYTTFKNCVFQGRANSTAAIATDGSNDNCSFIGCTFMYWNTATYGYAIYGHTYTADVIDSGWTIQGCKFHSNVNDIVARMRVAELTGNKFAGGGLAAAGTLNLTTTAAINLSGGSNAGYNTVFGNLLGGNKYATDTTPSYTAGASTDNWVGNYSGDVDEATVEADGLTIAVPTTD